MNFFSICVCALIVYEVERVEDQVLANRKKLLNSIKRNVKRQSERPKIDFTKVRDE